jgi:hypothetical protein
VPLENVTSGESTVPALSTSCTAKDVSGTPPGLVATPVIEPSVGTLNDAVSAGPVGAVPAVADARSAVSEVPSTQKLSVQPAVVFPNVYCTS